MEKFQFIKIHFVCTDNGEIHSFNLSHSFNLFLNVRILQQCNLLLIFFYRNGYINYEEIYNWLICAVINGLEHIRHYRN